MNFSLMSMMNIKNKMRLLLLLDLILNWKEIPVKVKGRFDLNLSPPDATSVKDIGRKLTETHKSNNFTVADIVPLDNEIMKMMVAR